MRFFVLPAAVTLGAIIMLTACKATDGGNITQATPTPATPSPSAPVRPQGDGVRRITVADALAAMDKGEAVMLDVRLKTEYDAKHIKGSLSIPKGEILARADELPKGKLIIAYCA